MILFLLRCFVDFWTHIWPNRKGIHSSAVFWVPTDAVYTTGSHWKMLVAWRRVQCLLSCDCFLGATILWSVSCTDVFLLVGAEQVVQWLVHRRVLEFLANFLNGLLLTHVLQLLTVIWTLICEKSDHWINSFHRGMAAGQTSLQASWKSREVLMCFCSHDLLHSLSSHCF